MGILCSKPGGGEHVLGRSHDKCVLTVPERGPFKVEPESHQINLEKHAKLSDERIPMSSATMSIRRGYTGESRADTSPNVSNYVLGGKSSSNHHVSPFLYSMFND